MYYSPIGYCVLVVNDFGGTYAMYKAYQNIDDLVSYAKNDFVESITVCKNINEAHLIVIQKNKKFKEENKYPNPKVVIIN